MSNNTGIVFSKQLHAQHVHVHTTARDTCTITRKCTTLWGEPGQVHVQNMEQLHAFDCHQNVAEPQARENHIKYTHCTQEL